MTQQSICPCPNLSCPNHGHCDRCTSRHARLGYLNYCAFHTILPTVRQVIAEDPESKAAKKLDALIAPQLEAYRRLMEAHQVSRDDQDRLFESVKAYSDH